MHFKLSLEANYESIHDTPIQGAVLREKKSKSQRYKVRAAILLQHIYNKLTCRLQKVLLAIKKKGKIL